MSAFVRGHIFPILAAILAAACQRQRPAPPVSDASTRTEVLAAQRARFLAITRPDLDALDTLLAPDLQYTHTTGTTETKPQFLATLREKRIVYDSILPNELEVIPLGPDAGVVTGRSRMVIRAGGESRSFVIRFTEVLVRRDGRWQTVAWQSTRVP